MQRKDKAVSRTAGFAISGDHHRYTARLIDVVVGKRREVFLELEMREIVDETG